jgi:hypothetical protein
MISTCTIICIEVEGSKMIQLNNPQYLTVSIIGANDIYMGSDET